MPNSKRLKLPICDTKSTDSILAFWSMNAFQASNASGQIRISCQKVEASYLNRKIAQGVLGQKHVIRVVFEEIKNAMLVITVYPAGRRRYGE